LRLDDAEEDRDPKEVEREVRRPGGQLRSIRRSPGAAAPQDDNDAFNDAVEAIAESR
jgi:hypothetical protein